MIYDYKKQQKEYYAPSKEPEIITIPAMNYIAVRGIGNPNDVDGEYPKAISLLYSVSYTLKMSYKGEHKIKGFFEYVVPPLEGFWWQDQIEGVDYANKSGFHWISIIRLPDFVTRQDFEWAKQQTEKKKKIDCSKVEFLSYDEGICVQCMHFGTFDEEPETVQKMNTFIEKQRYVTDITEKRFHHEIYISDPRKCDPEKQRTVLRHPIRKA